ncbi:MAG: 30S ribosomal protein S17 [Candidatus Colwellbacteria bacterium CG10_big_fil_rev_8_21_14_0_10_42_22]|uniref:Small ribosomal subunit protein uS17 n=1 Tax=Candidatus Colwellbacteria bacterium CG10_big_fil_rev_8_21_14_0_10_42_22 TaxID=1974540 RepID=A0A2H0VF99_9BACT|nr:MAG: 30S ribosomal protein S17 [Candidatus Colwellbacteria bacterium CG10_big_fil_rev_8_21_14_0_10_42_22]
MEKQITKRRLKGVVTSDKMEKTVVVTVSTNKKHPKYHKYFKQSSKFKAHDEENRYKTGDEVVIEETRPLSRDKRWKVIGFIKDEKNSQ